MWLEAGFKWSLIVKASTKKCTLLRISTQIITEGTAVDHLESVFSTVDASKVSVGV